MPARPPDNLPHSRGMLPIVTDGVCREQDSKSSVGNHVRVQGYVDSGIEPSGPGPVSARHFADTSAESSAQMRDDFEATSSAIWCRAKIQGVTRRLRRDVAQ